MLLHCYLSHVMYSLCYYPVIYSLCYYPVTANCLHSLGLRWKTFWIRKFDTAWPHLAVGIISVGVSCMVNWPALRVSGPCSTRKSLKNSQERKHGLENWHFLTWSQNSCHSVQCEFPYDRSLCHAFMSVTLFLLHCHVQTFFSGHLWWFLVGRNLLVPQQSLSCVGWRVLLTGMWHDIQWLEQSE
jgi:hypothetical protein